MQWTERLGYRLKLRDLHILMAVAECGSMSKAAQRLSVSPPVVSKAIADIEHAFGVRLLDRTPQGIEPTVYGRTLLNSGVVAFDALRQGARQIEFLSNPTTGEVRIGCNEPFAAGLLPAIIEKMGRKYPGIVCHVVQTPSAPTLEFHELRERRVDLLVGRFDRSIDDSDLEAQLLYYERIYVVAGRHSKWARRQKIVLSELINEPWIMTPPNTLPTLLMERAFLASNVSLPKESVVSLSIHLRNTLLASGRYLSILPGSLIRYGVLRKLVKVLPVELPAEPGPVGIITLKNRILSPTAKIFIDVAQQLSEPLLSLDASPAIARRNSNRPLQVRRK
jgi:DNA-binding transcriptional LysR family regulator